MHSLLRYWSTMMSWSKMMSSFWPLIAEMTMIWVFILEINAFDAFKGLWYWTVFADWRKFHSGKDSNEQGFWIDNDNQCDHLTRHGYYWINEIKIKKRNGCDCMWKYILKYILWMKTFSTLYFLSCFFSVDSEILKS